MERAERPIPEGTDLVLQSARGERTAVTLNPDGSVTLEQIDTADQREQPVIHLDGVSARILRDWMRRELVG